MRVGRQHHSGGVQDPDLGGDLLGGAVGILDRVQPPGQQPQIVIDPAGHLGRRGGPVALGTGPAGHVMGLVIGELAELPLHRVLADPLLELRDLAAGHLLSRRVLDIHVDVDQAPLSADRVDIGVDHRVVGVRLDVGDQAVGAVVGHRGGEAGLGDVVLHGDFSVSEKGFGDVACPARESNPGSGPTGAAGSEVVAGVGEGALQVGQEAVHVAGQGPVAGVTVVGPGQLVAVVGQREGDLLALLAGGVAVDHEATEVGVGQGDDPVRGVDVQTAQNQLVGALGGLGGDGLDAGDGGGHGVLRGSRSVPCL
ncbi:hypothetical protein B9M80_12725 [Mycobacteroides abscessus]|nr:hypothetical protein B9M80_12725 [Mycobacteroides abscessus]